MASTKTKQKKKTEKITRVGEDAEWLEPLCTVGGNVNGTDTMENVSSKN